MVHHDLKGQLANLRRRTLEFHHLRATTAGRAGSRPCYRHQSLLEGARRGARNWIGRPPFGRVNLIACPVRRTRAEAISRDHPHRRQR